MRVWYPSHTVIYLHSASATFSMVTFCCTPCAAPLEKDRKENMHKSMQTRKALSSPLQQTKVMSDFPEVAMSLEKSVKFRILKKEEVFAVKDG
jgi:hypothetical protein